MDSSETDEDGRPPNLALISNFLPPNAPLPLLPLPEATTSSTRDQNERYGIDSSSAHPNTSSSSILASGQSSQYSLSTLRGVLEEALHGYTTSMDLDSSFQIPQGTSRASANSTYDDNDEVSSIFGSPNRPNSSLIRHNGTPNGSASAQAIRSLALGVPQAQPQETTGSASDQSSWWGWEASRAGAQILRRLERQLAADDLTADHRRIIQATRNSFLQSFSMARSRLSRVRYGGFLQNAAADDEDRGSSEIDTTRGAASSFQFTLSRSHANAIISALVGLQPQASLLYMIELSPSGSDEWPDLRHLVKLPAKVTPIVFSAYSAQLFKDARNMRREKQFAKSPTYTECLATNNCPSRAVWPKNVIPLEVYNLILRYLSRDDIKALRRTCKDIEHRISHLLFETAVVPFNTEIYGMLHTNSKDELDIKGKGKFGGVNANPAPGGLLWKNASNDDVYNGHGVDVFRGFGPHIRRYGMSFEVDEDVLSALPRKGTLELIRSYWGEYEWPFPGYTRFKEVASLENAADETPKMKVAFSYLTQVKNLALSIDSGLGWLHGPDVTLYTRITKKPPPVYGQTRDVPERKEQNQRDLWNMLLDQRYNSPNKAQLAISNIRNKLLPFSKRDFDEIVNINIAAGVVDPDVPLVELRSLMDPTKVDSELEKLTMLASNLNHPDFPFGLIERNNMFDEDGEDAYPEQDQDWREEKRIFGILACQEETYEDGQPFICSLVPNSLTQGQKEWLLETEWAQRAFISSYMLSVIDNPIAFKNVHTLNLARISSRYLNSICRDDFWDSLTQIQEVSIQVIAEWRDIWKDEAGYVEAPLVAPSGSCKRFEHLLRDIIAPRSNIKRLKIGWASGGEHETGIFGRNQNILPAPFLPYDWLVGALADDEALDNRMVRFPHVQSLTIANSWMPPSSLALFVKKHEDGELSKLILDSVSITSQRSDLVHLLGNPVPTTYNPNNLPFIANNIVAQAAVPHVANLPLHLLNSNFAMGAANTSLSNSLNGNNSAAAASNSAPNPSWLGPYRIGSWAWLLDTISPGPTLADHSLSWSYRNIIPPTSPLRTIEFRSCGYARVNVPGLDQSEIGIGNVGAGIIAGAGPGAVGGANAGAAAAADLGLAAAAAAGQRSSCPLLARRSTLFAPLMLPQQQLQLQLPQPQQQQPQPQLQQQQHCDSLLGQIVPLMPHPEQQALAAVWGLQMGWEDAERAEEAVYDGCLPGGTARFSGTVDRRAGMGIVMAMAMAMDVVV